MIVVFEGPDGSGKSTQARMFAQRLHDAGLPFSAFTQPSVGSDLGLFIRGVLAGSSQVDPHALALLFAADRTNQLPAIQAALARGETVVSDRWFYSSYVYQWLLGCDAEWLHQINAHLPPPDLLVYNRAFTADLLLKSIRARRTTTEIYETSEMIRRAAERYDALIADLQEDGLNVLVLHSFGDAEILAERVWKAFRDVSEGIFEPPQWR